MSTMDAMDDALLGVDDDELDYDLEKDEEDALLADDNYEENYDEPQADENEEQQNEEGSDILDIDSNVALDETEEDFGDQSKDIRNSAQGINQQENDEEDEVEEQKERNRFLNERNNIVQRPNSNEIPDTLEKVAVQPVPQSQTNYQRNGRSQRGNRGRGRGRQNYNRGSVFGRVGNIPNIPIEGKTVLINPHFRGNVQVSENARLVWDPNFQSNNNNFSQQQRYQGTQMAQVAPYQSQIPVWSTQAFNEPSNNFNHPPSQPNYQEPAAIQYNQPPDLMALRPLIQANNNQQPSYAAQQQLSQHQGNFRGRDTRFPSQPSIPSLIMNNPPPAFNQQSSFQARNNFNNFPDQNMPNQNRPFINPSNQNAPALLQIQPNYVPQQPNFDQPPPNFPAQNQFNQNRQPVYDQYNDHNQFQNSVNQFQSPMHNNQNYQGSFQQTVNYESNYIPPNQIPQETFPQKQFNHHQFNQNRPNQRNQMNQYNNRTPPKRRSFDNSTGSGDRDLPKKKKRSMEFSNLHEVPTVDMPDTTTEEKEEEDEETKAYRLKIEEQKRLREQILREKEERRKIAAALKVENLDNTQIPTTGNLLATLKNKTINQQPLQQKQINQQQQPKQIPNIRQQNEQRRPQQQQQQQQQQNQSNRNQQRPKQPIQQRKIQTNIRSQNIQVQANAPSQRPNQQRRIQQSNIVITQTNQSQQQRVVMLKQNANPTKINANRRVLLKGLNESNVSEPNSQENQDGGNLSSFLSNRKVISKSATSSVELSQPPMLDTPVVVVSNLAAGTTDAKIKKLCQGLGPIQVELEAKLVERLESRINREGRSQTDVSKYDLDVEEGKLDN